MEVSAMLNGQALLVSAYTIILLQMAFSPRTLASASEIKSIAQSLELQCPPCEKLHCNPRKAKRLRCKGGITRGICNCCPVCAKLRGEICGGHHNYRGKCDIGLRCEPEETYVKKYMDTMSPTQRKSWIPEGRCVKVLPHEQGYGQMDQPVAAYCKPKCTADYCTSNPRAICSAIDNAEKTQGCQGDCQHTSCRACRFVKEEPGCGKCAQDDFECIKNFGRCIKESICTRRKHPCRPNSVVSGAKFQCVVPDCVNP